MKKILALLLASVMALSLAACGGNTSDETTDTTGTTENNTTTEANPADAISDTMTLRTAPMNWLSSPTWVS